MHPGALSRDALDGHSAAVSFDDIPDDRQSQSRSWRGRALDEAVEHPRQHLRGYALAVVTNGDLGTSALTNPDNSHGTAPRRVPQRVADEIGNNPAEPGCVASDR